MPTGYSLLEVLLVIGILALVWAMVLLPGNALLKSFLLSSTASGLASELRELQAEAQTLHGKAKVIFYRNQNNFWAYQKIFTRADASEKTSREKLLPAKIYLTSNLPANALIFNPNGNPQKAGQIIFFLEGSGKKRSLVISPVGRIRVTNAY